MLMGLYNGFMTKVQRPFQDESFKMKIGLHQESVLSPLLLIIMMDFTSKQIHMEDGKQLICADNIALMAKSKEDLIQATDAWNSELTNYGLKMNKEMTEIMQVTHGEPKEMTINIEGLCLNYVSAFK